MQPAARVGDMHTCPMQTPGLPPIPHVGGPVLPPGCPTVLIGGMPAARVGDMAVCVGPFDLIKTGSSTVLIGGKPAARLIAFVFSDAVFGKSRAMPIGTTVCPIGGGVTSKRAWKNRQCKTGEVSTSFLPMTSISWAPFM